jgi:hypothetical protein
VAAQQKIYITETTPSPLSLRPNISYGSRLICLVSEGVGDSSRSNSLVGRGNGKAKGILNNGFSQLFCSLFSIFNFYFLNFLAEASLPSV